MAAPIGGRFSAHTGHVYIAAIRSLYEMAERRCPVRRNNGLVHHLGSLLCSGPQDRRDDSLNIPRADSLMGRQIDQVLGRILRLRA
jgi:hypothetical protein